MRADVGSGALPSIAFAIVKDGEIVHEKAFGQADAQERIASTVNTPYPLASATKPIVATALMVLRERGQIDLDAPAARYARDWLSREGQLLPDYSVGQLLNHTSGLGTYARIYWRDQNRPVRSLEESFREYGFTAHPPGTVSEYSNLGYGLIGHLIARQTPRPPHMLCKLCVTRIMQRTEVVEVDGLTLRKKKLAVDPRVKELDGFSATDLARSVGEVTREVMKRGAAVITRHDEPIMVVLSVDRYLELEKAAAPNLEALSREFDAMYARMQAPGVAKRTIKALDLGRKNSRRRDRKPVTSKRSVRQRG
ncbi:hypothetical protein BH24PSE2_BH24PSE2_20580 [soil metagenome]